MTKKTRNAKKDTEKRDAKTEECEHDDEKQHANVQNAVLKRALKERMYFLSILDDTDGQADEEGAGKRGGNGGRKEACFLLTGQSGMLYTVRLPTGRGGNARCNCPDHLIRKRACKHILFMTHRVLKLRYSSDDDEGDDDEIRASDGLSGLRGRHREIRDAVAKLRPDSSVRAPAAVQRAFELAVPREYLRDGKGGSGASGGVASKVEPRKIEDGDECPICYEEFGKDESLLYCTKGCGKGVHEDCMRRYAEAANGGRDDSVRCVFCRAEWVFPEDDGKATDVEAVGERGLLVNRRLIDLSELAEGSFSVARTKRSVEPEEDEDEGDSTDGGERDGWGCVDDENGESVNERTERQKSERADRAKRWAERRADGAKENAPNGVTRKRAASTKSERVDAERAESGKRQRVGRRTNRRRE